MATQVYVYTFPGLSAEELCSLLHACCILVKKLRLSAKDLGVGRGITPGSNTESSQTRGKAASALCHTSRFTDTALVLGGAFPRWGSEEESDRVERGQ